MGCFLGRHVWDGCVCVKCGETRHEFEVIREEVTGGDGCCWAVSEPCIGPHCGSFCDSYYPGRAGWRTLTLRCRRCGLEQTREEAVEDPH